MLAASAALRRFCTPPSGAPAGLPMLRTLPAHRRRGHCCGQDAKEGEPWGAASLCVALLHRLVLAGCWLLLHAGGRCTPRARPAHPFPYPAPRLIPMGAPTSPQVLHMAGLEDCYTSSRGNTKTLGNQVRATFYALAVRGGAGGQLAAAGPSRGLGRALSSPRPLHRSLALGCSETLPPLPSSPPPPQSTYAFLSPDMWAHHPLQISPLQASVCHAVRCQNCPWRPWQPPARPPSPRAQRCSLLRVAAAPPSWRLRPWGYPRPPPHARLHALLVPLRFNACLVPPGPAGALRLPGQPTAAFKTFT